MKYGSVCSGIEAASAAWHAIGWTPAWFAEIEPFPAAVLAHHYPDVANLGDMTTIARRVLCGEIEAPEVLVGGTPCQAFSVAGLRQSLADERGNLTIKYVELADAIDHVRTARGEQPSVIVWENVPGVLSTGDNAFGCFLGALAGADCELQPAGKRWTDAGCVYGSKRAVAWRILDAQYFGLAQRRRRVFVVASARDGFDPAAVLLEWNGVRRDSAPSREAREGTAACAAPGAEVGGWPADVASTLNAAFGSKQGLEDQHIRGGAPLFVPHTAHTLRAEGFDASEDGTGRVTPLVPVALQDVSARDKAQNGRGWNDDGAAYTLDAAATQGVAVPVAKPVAFMADDYKDGTFDACDITGPMTTSADMARASAVIAQEVVAALTASGRGVERCGESRGQDPVVATGMQVRRLTPVECERLQGFPDNHTRIPWRKKDASECPDGPRYKALGNSMAVPVMRWIGQRIDKMISK